MLEQGLQPAHLGWRVAQSLTDDLFVTAVALGFAAVLGMLPDSASMRGLVQVYDQPLELARRL